jgi:hypothetical protein
MDRFNEDCAALEGLESFDPAAFESSADVPQKLCNLVLSVYVKASSDRQ